MSERKKQLNASSVCRRAFLKLSTVASASVLVSCREANQNSSTKNANLQNQTTGEPPSITHRKIHTNGINMHIAEAGKGLPVIFLHGFAELWYSWRHQLPAIAAAGFHAVAPDLRGFGQTEVPQEVESYSTKNRAADLVGLMDALNAERCALVGNDWGSGLAWALAQLHPERVVSMFHLNIAYAERGNEPPTAAIAKFAGGRFNFALHVQKPGVAESEFERDVAASMRRFLYAFSGEAPPNVAEYFFRRKSANTDVLEGMPEPEKLPDWLSEADLDYYTREYSRTGFTGPLNMYRNMDHDWKELPQVGTGEVRQPVLFMGGRRDPSVIYLPFDQMIRAVPKLRKIILLENCGHWVQQERAADVNRELVAFLTEENKTGN